MIFLKTFKRCCLEAILEFDQKADRASALRFYSAMRFWFDVARKRGLKGKQAVMTVCKDSMDAQLVINTHLKNRRSIAARAKVETIDISEVKPLELLFLTYRLANAIASSTPREALPDKFLLSFDRFGDLSVWGPDESAGKVKAFFDGQIKSDTN